MSTDKRRRIKQLRALASSTTFPEEAASAQAKADKLEAELPAVDPCAGSFTFPEHMAVTITPEQMEALFATINAQLDARILGGLYGSPLSDFFARAVKR